MSGVRGIAKPLGLPLVQQLEFAAQTVKGASIREDINKEHGQQRQDDDHRRALLSSSSSLWTIDCESDHNVFCGTARKEKIG